MRRLEVPDAVEGTRGLLLGTGLLLLAAMVEPALPAGFPRWTFTVPAAALLLTGLLTVPREGLAAQQRVVQLAEDGGWRPIAKRLGWLVLVVLLLLPRLFLALYGIPHMNPLAGVVPQQWLVRAATVSLFLILLFAVLHLRAGRHGSTWPKPADLPEHDPRVRSLDSLLVGMLLLAVVWGLLLRPFWAPFSLLQWPPELWSLGAGARGVAAVAFSIVPPVVLFMALSAHVALARRLAHAPRGADRDKALAAAGAHIALTLLAAFLHAYDLLWVARYESLSRF